MANISMLRKVLDRIEQVPCLDDTASAEDWNGDGWDQGSWLLYPGDSIEMAVTVTDAGLETDRGVRCGTAGCFAGWAAVMFAPPGTRFRQEGVMLPGDSREYHISEYARELLGLSKDDAARLFAGGNSLSELQRIVRELEATAEGGA